MEERNAPRLLESLIDEIELRCAPEIGAAEAREFRVSCLTLISASMPPSCSEALRVLRNGVLRTISTEALNALDDSCKASIQDLDSNSSSFGAILATGIALYAELHPHEKNFSDHTRSFVDAINGVDPLYEKCIELLQQLFPSCLKRS